MLAKASGGEEIPASQDTEWLRVEGEWYRAISDPQMRLK
jgi:hypothetical protein